MRVLSYLSSVLCFLLVTTTCHANGKATLCKTNEIDYFSCKTQAKVVSLCASKNLSSTDGYMQFRYGRRGNIELRFPPEDRHPKGLFTNTHENYTDGTEFGLHFNVGELTYTVYNTITFPGPSRDPANRHGLRIEKGDKFIREIECRPTNREDVYYFDLGSEFLSK